MHLCVHACACEYCLCAYACVCMCTYRYMFMCLGLHLCVSVYAYIHCCACIHVRICECVYVCVVYPFVYENELMHTCVYACTCVHVYVWHRCEWKCMKPQSKTRGFHFSPQRQPALKISRQGARPPPRTRRWGGHPSASPSITPECQRGLSKR